ncbi:hypothetical protein [Nakamurella sp. PAMC28650]|jgi:hypothetical protein|uniref:hypothetical protein n=1 Tax=Nakamurella sp. PAMC28650 TaxID=2762325 RepID=UPI00164D38B7|nr:hypothetical protein [Nakamurella sp. PAMC28650]QNK80512.1 hypothetical protein H7F38_20450 [Nakamurella sp. PAMC28650]
MFTPDRASAAIASHNRGQKKRCVSLDDVARDLGLGLRPRAGALAWVNEIILAVDAVAASEKLAADQLAS